MKRHEVTAENLRKLGYVAKAMTHTFANGFTERELNDKQSSQLFDLTVRRIRGGEKFEIRRNLCRKSVEVTVYVADTNFRGCECYYYLSRPMTEAEVTKASSGDGYMVHSGA